MRLFRSLLVRLSTSLRVVMATEGSSQDHQQFAEIGKNSELKLYNSLTRRKETFVPLTPPTVTWYSCGPTVYDAAHMGHARSYITFDILRRVLSDYFGYHVNYVMNITDIDDKIIRRARRNHLLEQYTNKQPSLATLIADVTKALQPFTEKALSETDPDKKAMLQGVMEKVNCALEEAKKDSAEGAQVTNLLMVAADPLSDWLDCHLGSEVRDKSIFASLTQQFEEEFHNDMEALNVLPPDVLTRVSEYVPEVVEYIQHIINKGFGYESNGSVYFDVVKFSSSSDHTYAKLVPEAVGDLSALAEGEGELSVQNQGEKRGPSDFALWKASKAGEPSWSSPWGQGRPGWHIECSVMACDILGERADIHTGGVDLKFPHHDNEIAQAEARYGSDQWITHFLHSGHLTIAGCKMSKSLKNFITIKEALQKHSSRQLRLAFLLHSWSATLDYSDATMREAQHCEKLFNEFFLTVKDLLRKQPKGVASYLKFTDREKQLLAQLTDTEVAVHRALCDSVDTPQAMRVMKELVTTSNIYLSEQTSSPNARLLQNIAKYLTDMLRVFGVVPEDSSLGFPVVSTGVLDEETVAMPYLNLLAQFREDIRKRALEVKDGTLLRVCDDLRDHKLAELGVRMEDREKGTVVKIVGREAIMREREMERQAQEERVRAKEEQKRKMEEAKRQREEQAAIPPQQMFLNQTDKYSAFDEQGLPTHGEDGTPLSEKQVKKLRKMWQAQEKKYQDHLSKK